jgi:hypothetical protein
VPVRRLGGWAGFGSGCALGWGCGLGWGWAGGWVAGRGAAGLAAGDPAAGGFVSALPGRVAGDDGFTAAAGASGPAADGVAGFAADDGEARASAGALAALDFGRELLRSAIATVRSPSGTTCARKVE